MAGRGLFLRGELVLEFVRLTGEAVREDKETRDPEADKDAETLAVSAVLAGSGEPCHDRGDDGKEAEVEAHIRDKAEIDAVVGIAGGLDVIFDFRGVHRSATLGRATCGVNGNEIS